MPPKNKLPPPTGLTPDDEKFLKTLWQRAESVQKIKNHQSLDVFLKELEYVKKRYPELKALKPAVAAANYRHYAGKDGLQENEYHALFKKFIVRCREIRLQQHQERAKQPQKPVSHQVRDSVRKAGKHTGKFLGLHGDQQNMDKMRAAYAHQRGTRGVTGAARKDDHHHGYLPVQPKPTGPSQQEIDAKRVEAALSSHDEHEKIKNLPDEDRLKHLMHDEDKAIEYYHALIHKEKTALGHSGHGVTGGVDQPGHPKHGKLEGHVREHEARLNDRMVAMQLQALPVYKPYFMYATIVCQLALVLYVVGSAYTEQANAEMGFSYKTSKCTPKICTLNSGAWTTTTCRQRYGVYFESGPYSGQCVGTPRMTENWCIGSTSDATYAEGSDPACPTEWFSDYTVIPDAEATRTVNPWFGPTLQGLIHYGASYPPCMRDDKKIEQAAKDQRDSQCLSQSASDSQYYRYTVNGKTVEPQRCGSGNGLGCCKLSFTYGPSLTAGTSSATITESECTAISTNYGPSGTVAKIVTTATFEADKICDLDTTLTSQYAVRGRPCCYGFKGKCMLASEDYCDYKNGTFYTANSMCSQVYCLEEVCNGKEDRSDTQKSFAQKSTVAKGYETRPDVKSNTPTSNYPNRAARNEPKQGYRFITAIYMSAGLIQFIIYGSFTYKVGTSIEKNIGFLRMAIIYFLTGIGANIFAGNLAPYAVMMGQGGVSMGLLSCMIVDLLQFWPIVPKCYHELAQLLGTVAVTFIIGLLPSLDNFQHLGGFLFGIPCALIMLPFLTFGKWDHARKRAIFALAFPCLLIAFVVTTVTFYSVQNQADESGFNCLKFESDYMCSNTYEDGD